MQAVVAQALPRLLRDYLPSADLTSEALADVTSLSAALEFVFLPVMAHYTDCKGRRPLLIAVPMVMLLVQCAVLLVPNVATIIASRLLLGLFLEAFILLVGISCADIFRQNSAMLAAFEGRTAGFYGAAFAVGMLIGGQALAGGTGLLALRAAYGWSAVLAAAAVGLVLVGAEETLPKTRRPAFALRECSPLGFFRLFRSGKLLAVLGVVLSLQTLHDGEGDVWQVYATEMRGWGTHENAVYGAAVGLSSTLGGLLTGCSVRWLGGWLHTVAWTVSTAVSNLLFMTRSSLLAFISVPFSAAEDCMSAAVIARMMHVGSSLGVGRGQLASDIHNLEACVRVFGLLAFGKLFASGMRAGIPQLAYVACALAQLLAVVLMLSVPSDRGDRTLQEDVVSVA